MTMNILTLIIYGNEDNNALTTNFILTLCETNLKGLNVRNNLKIYYQLIKMNR